MKGFVYIMTNKAMPNIFKIGYSQKDPAIRAEELETTGIPHPFVVEYEALVDEPYEIEQKVHSALADDNEGKEWFNCSYAKCVSAIRECSVGKIYYEFSIKEKIESERRAEEEKLKQLEFEKLSEQKRQEYLLWLEKENSRKELEAEENLKRLEASKIESENKLREFLFIKLKPVRLVYYGICLLAVLLAVLLATLLFDGVLCFTVLLAFLFFSWVIYLYVFDSYKSTFEQEFKDQLDAESP